MLRTLRSVVRLRSRGENRTSRKLRLAANVDDLRRIAQQRLPRGVFDYIDGGAEDELTLDRNIKAFRKTIFRPRVLRGIESIDSSTTLLGRHLEFPLVLAPTGFTRIADPDGEIAVIRAAARAGVPFTLSTMGTCSIEDCAKAAGPKARLWFQVYTWRNRSLLRSLVDRAAEAGFEALCVTVDTPVLGRRERDIRRGFTLPPEIGLETLIDGLRHPSWTWRFLRSEPIRFASAVGADGGDGSSAIDLAEYMASQFDPTLSWQDLEWFRSIWKGPIVLKGIQTVADARLAVESGIQAIVVSNHGGRQLDGAPVPLEILPSIVQEVGDSLEVICDGGVRRGSDIVKAVALGASSVMAGRLYLYALGAAGEAGVDHVLDLMKTGMERTMALIGSSSVDSLNPELVELRS